MTHGSAPDCAPHNAALQYVAASGYSGLTVYRIYERGTYLGALHSLDAVTAFMAAVAGDNRRAA